MPLLQSALQNIILPSILLFLLLASVVAIGIGIGLIFRSEGVFKLFRSTNQWVSTRESFKQLDIPHDLDATLRRQRRLLGGVFLVCAGFSLAVLFQKFDVAALTPLLARKYPAGAVAMGLQVVKTVLLVFNALAILVGLSLIAFPELLAKIEARTNRWYSARVATKDMDIMHLTLDKWVEAHPRGAGWMLIILAAFVVLNLGMLIYSRL